MTKRSFSWTLLVFLTIVGLSCGAFASALLGHQQQRSWQQRKGPITSTSVVTNVSGGADIIRADYSGQASVLFGNLRIPAALFAGAAAGAAFAMPILPNEGLKIGMAKRLYSLLMMGSLSAELIAIIVSTLAMSAISMRPATVTSSTRDLLAELYDFEWVTAKLHFLLGILMFVAAAGLRASVSIACPVFAKAAVGLIVSSTVFCLAVIDEGERESGSSLLAVPVKFVRLMLGRIKSEPLFAVSLLVFAVTSAYIITSSPHVYQYLTA